VHHRIGDNVGDVQVQVFPFPDGLLEAFRFLWKPSLFTSSLNTNDPNSQYRFHSFSFPIKGSTGDPVFPASPEGPDNHKSQIPPKQEKKGKRRSELQRLCCFAVTLSPALFFCQPGNLNFLQSL
jgi:hypothetical protein